MALFRYNATSNKLIPITSEGSVGIPVGAVMAFAKGATNENWLLCDGRDTTGTAEELHTHYPALYYYLGNSNVLPAQFDHSKLSEWEDITLPTSAATAITMNYDGELFFMTGASGGTYVYIYINGIRFNFGEAPSGGGGNNISTCMPFKKGDVIYVSKSGTAKVAYYNQPLYIKATSAGIEVDKDLYATKGYIRDQNILSEWEDPVFTQVLGRNKFIAQYDGIINLWLSTNTVVNATVFINSMDISRLYPNAGVSAGAQLPIKKGDVLTITFINGSLSDVSKKVAYYKLRDYTGR